MRSLLLSSLLFIFLISSVSTGRKWKVSDSDRKMYGKMSTRKVSFWRRFWCFIVRCDPYAYLTRDEWKTVDEKRFGRLSFAEEVQHMEALDVEHERLLQKRMQTLVDVLLIAPSVATEGQPISAHPTLNPVLYIGKKYSIAFKLGQKYPIDRPFLSLYISPMRSEDRCSRGHALFIRTVYVQLDGVSNNFRVSLDWPDEFTSQDPRLISDYTEPEIIETSDGTYIIQWNVPDETVMNLDAKYCLLFDMSSLNPHQLPKKLMTLERNLNQIAPSAFKSAIHSVSHYHTLKQSPSFDVRYPPSLFSGDYFLDFFGGKDLFRFIGGELMSVKYFEVKYFHDRGRWSQPLFQKIVEDRAVGMKEWFQAMIESQGQRLESHWFWRKKTAGYDTGFAGMEERRQARMRAMGLLFHPNGRKTLKLIGETLLDIANTYQTAIKPLGRLIDFLRNVWQSFWEENISGFRDTHVELGELIKQLRLMCNNESPSEAVFQYVEEQTGKTSGSITLPSGHRVLAPQELRNKIEERMGDLVRYEIKLVLWKMGQLLLRRKSKGERWSETLLGDSVYDPDIYVQYASALRIYGTKFVYMANNFGI